MLLRVCAFVCACLCEIEEKREGRKQRQIEKKKEIWGERVISGEGVVERRTRGRGGG